MAVSFNGKHLAKFIRPEEYEAIYPQVELAHNQLESKTGAGNDFLGWLDLPVTYDKEGFARIKEAAQKIRSDSDVLLVAGIGGSYLGARAVVEAVKGLYHNEADDGLKIYFCGNTISPTALNDIIKLTKGKRFSINVISKSGTTTETALAFRVLRKLLEDSVGTEEANKRIYATTDRAKGTLKQLATEQGWPTFVVPDDVGGRYSVLSAVGLLPLCAAGIDIEKILTVAEETFASLDERSEANPCWQYAAARQALYKSGKAVEILACYEPRFRMMAEWWKQLYGESEGKNGLGIFPASVEYNADLHSMGQYIQEGPRHLMETVVSFASLPGRYTVPADAHDGDGLNYLAGHDFNEIAAIARAAVKTAHIEGGVPNLAIEVTDMAETGFAELVCFFELACGISGYMEGVNPFDQPGVEAYKKLMFRGLAALK